MARGKRQAQGFFVQLCEQYYEQVLRYLSASLGSEAAAKDCTQEVFLTACRKRELLEQHPNPGGFLFQTAKNLARKTRREAFAAMLRDEDLEGRALADEGAQVETALDRGIDEQTYVELALSRLSGEKRRLYEQYYHQGAGYSALAAQYGLQEAAVRMRLTRLRRELREICREIAEENFDA